MKPTIIHLLDHFNEGGTELSILDLIKAGFYRHVDLHVIGLARAHGPIHKQFCDLLGPKKVSCIYPNQSALVNLTDMGKAIPRLIAEYNRIRPQTVVMSLEMPNILGRAAATLFPDIKVVSFEHMTYYTAKRTLLLRLTASRVDAMFADSVSTAKYAHQNLYGISQLPAHNEHVVPISMLATSTARAPRSPKSFEVLSIGRLDPQKNYPALVEAVTHLIREGRNLNLTIVGEGYQRDEILSLAQQNGIADRVRLPGYISDQSTLANFRQRADIYIQPSLHEGLCRTVSEALAAGLPTIATATGGIKDYGPEAGILMMEKSDVKTIPIKTIQNSLAHLISNYENIAHLMSQQAVTAAEKNFNKQSALRVMGAAQRELVEPRFRDDPSRLAELGQNFRWLRHLGI